VVVLMCAQGRCHLVISEETDVQDLRNVTWNEEYLIRE